MATKKEREHKLTSLEKSPTGIQGLDEITFGGIPKGRPTLVCGGPGCGKTLFAMEFLYKGATVFNEPGVFLSFEEREEDLIANFASLGFDIKSLIDKNKFALDYVYIERSEIEETGAYDLEGLFVRIASSVETIGAKRIVLDTIEALFSGFTDETVLRAELRRLFRWLKDNNLTAIITGEKGENLLTKHGLEEYVADCVIFLDHRVTEQVATRRLKIVKYRGSKHGTNEFPFLIGDEGIFVFPIASAALSGGVLTEKISSGIRGLDALLENKGFYEGSVVLISGTAGSGKTSFISQFIDSVCQKRKRAIFFSFEESEEEIIRNIRNIGIDLQKWVDKGLLQFSTFRGSAQGLEQHLVIALNKINRFKPEAVVIDPVSTLTKSGTMNEAEAMLERLIDHLKNQNITVIATDLTIHSDTAERVDISISSLCDAWLRLSFEKKGNQRFRRFTILKARGIKHPLDTKELRISDKGIEIKEINEKEEQEDD